MGKILEELLKEIKNSELTEQIQIICDQISNEEITDDNPLNKFRPKGVNIFLCLDIPSIMKNDISFLCLEREFKDQFLASLWSGVFKKDMEEDDFVIKRINSISINENKTKNIMKKYAEILKHYRQRK